MAKRKEPHRAAVSITAFTSDGYGSGELLRADGSVDTIAVPLTMPGDRVEVTYHRKRKGAYQGRLEQMTEPSPQRIEPRCRHFGACGGCRWQHLSYQQQLENKEQAVHRAFSSLMTSATHVASIVGCEPPWHYRNKMEFSFSSDAKGERYLGLMMSGGGQKVVALQECHLVTPWFMKALEVTRHWWATAGVEAYHPYRDSGALRTLTLREGMRSGDRMAMLTVSGNPDFALSRQQMTNWVEAMQQAVTPPQGTLALFLRIQQIAKGTPTSFYEIHLGGLDHIREELYIMGSPEPLRCKVSPTAFFQPSTYQAEKLYSLALQLARLEPHMVVYDLYCGTGTLGLAAARHVRRVVGIELSHEAVLDARSNAELNGLTNIEFFSGDVAQVLADLRQQGHLEPPDLVIVDPPRAGLGDKAIAHLVCLRPRQIVYVSCNPVTQAADIAQLMRHGYQVKALQPIDQFPHTIHIENIVLLDFSG